MQGECKLINLFIQVSHTPCKLYPLILKVAIASAVSMDRKNSNGYNLLFFLVPFFSFSFQNL
jgi:hypothetical protein